MKIDMSVPMTVDINLYEDYECGGGYKYDTNARVTWDIQSIEIKDNIVKMRVERVYEDENASEIYDDNAEYCSSYIMKVSEIYDIDISKEAVLQSLRTKSEVTANIIASTFISGEILDFKYVSGEKLTKEQLRKYFICDEELRGETILVDANMT